MVQVLAELKTGDWFGGAEELMGKGDLQQQLIATASSNVEFYVINADRFIQRAGQELVLAIRNDAAFKNTYYFAR